MRLIFITSTTMLMGILQQATSVIHCCEGGTPMINDTCGGDRQIVKLPCKTPLFVGPKEEPLISFKVQQDDSLLLLDEDNLGYIKVDQDKYCLAKDASSDGDVAVVCVEEEQNVFLTKKSITLIATKVTCAFISFLFLFAVFLVYLLVPDLRDIEGKCVLNFVASLCVAFFFIIILPAVRHFYPHICNSATFIYYISIVCSFNWLTILSFHLWRITIKPFFMIRARWFLIYCCYGYALPLVLLISAVILYQTLETGPTVRLENFLCWVDGNGVVWGYFYGPTMVMLLLSVVLQYSLAKKIWRNPNACDPSQSTRSLQKKSLTCMHLLLVFGQAKIIDIITYVHLETLHNDTNYLWQISDCRNLLIGGAVFFILVVLRNKALKALAKNGLLCLKFPEKWKDLMDEEAEKEATLEQLL